MIKQFIESADDPEAVTNKMTAMNVLPGMVQPDDVAGAVSFLLSNDSRYITGHTLPICAGALARLG